MKKCLSDIKVRSRLYCTEHNSTHIAIIDDDAKAL